MVRHPGLSLVWIIPVAAAIMAGWLGWRSYANHGQTITITFETAAGIEGGMTKIKYKDADLGVVEKVEPTADLSHVIVTARIGKVAQPYLTEGARFWVVKPSLSTKDLSGLGTFISGPYIEFEPGKKQSLTGKPLKQFIGEQSPALIPADEPGETYTLHATQLGSISQGTPVYYHGIRVGEVLGYKLSPADGNATVSLFIPAPYNALVHAGTRFWNTSGVSVVVGSAGLKIQLESLQSILTGGIAFGVPPDGEPGALATHDTSFTLYPDIATAGDAVYARRIRFLLHFTQPVPGLVAGSAVRVQGLMVGQVTDVHIDYDQATRRLTVPVTIEVEADRMQLLHNATPPDKFEANMHDVFRTLVSSGLRARLASGNMLTGEKVVDLDLVPGAPPATLIEGGLYPEIPTAEADDLDSVMHSAKELLGKLQVTAQNINKIVGSPELMASVRSLNDTLKEADKALSSDHNGGDLAGTLRELKDAARSARVLTDYLEAHPEALLRGKPEKSAP